MGILPLQFAEGQDVESLGLTGEEVFDFPGLKALLDAKFANGRNLKWPGPPRPMAHRRGSRRRFASTLRRKFSITRTAAFSNTYCEGWPGITSGSREKSKAPDLIPGAFSIFEPQLNSDTHAEFCGLSLIAGVRVKVAWSTAVEFVTQAQLAAHVDTKRSNTHRY